MRAQLLEINGWCVILKEKLLLFFGRIDGITHQLGSLKSKIMPFIVLATQGKTRPAQM